VPVSATVWAVGGALLETVSVPVRLPVAVGEKVTAIWQLALTASVDGQALLT
jgi:hypothetical protein